MAADGKLHLDGEHKVVTPEYVEFNFVLAGLQSRFLALMIDAIVSTMLTVAIVTVLSIFSIIAGGFAGAAMAIALFLVNWGYMILLESVWSGQTIGKKAMGLRVIQESGVRVDFFTSAIRNIARPIDQPFPFFYLIGGIATLFSGSQQRLGDMLAGTIVVRERRLKIPASLQRPDGDLSLLNDPDFRSRVSRISADEEKLLITSSLRREELGMEARLKLFSTLSTRLQDEWGFEKPAHLSDEKLVLLVTAGLVAKETQQAKKKSVSPKRFSLR